MMNLVKKVTDVDVSLIHFTELKDNKQVKGMKTAYPIYNLPSKLPLIIQLPAINLYPYGVPKIDAYHKTFDEINYIKIPIAHNTDIHKLLQEIDYTMNSNEMKKKFFGEEYDKYEYMSLLKVQTMYPSYIKAKLDLSYETKAFETECFVNKERVDIDDVNEFSKICTYKSDVKCIIKFSKLWSSNYRYGITLKLIKINIEKSTT